MVAPPLFSSNRRRFLIRLSHWLAAIGLSSLFTGPSTAAAPTVLQQALEGGDWQPDARIRLTVPPLAENGAMVPVHLESDVPDTRELLILVERNPNPLAARVECLPGAIARVSLRVRLNESGTVLAIARTPNGNFGVRQSVKVMQGGCG
jgi:sulfur-oxidizing protein SoxY